MSSTASAISATATAIWCANAGPPQLPRRRRDLDTHRRRAEAYREHCEHLRHEERELRDRLAYTLYGEHRERLEHRLGEIDAEREQCPRREPAPALPTKG
jgi:predicted RNase H-like nuclease (RuvC/YqgF family)